MLRRRENWWFVANILGIAAFLWLASRTWIEPWLRGEGISREGDAQLFMTTALPLLVLFTLGNVGWVIVSAVRRNWLSCAVTTLFILLWGAATQLHRANF